MAKFKPGQSGNPGGRPKVVGAIKELARQAGPKAFQRIVDLCDSEDQQVALAACKEVMSRAYGKSPQPLVLGEGETATDEPQISSRELARRLLFLALKPNED